MKTPLIVCWLLMFSKGQTLPALCNIACQSAVIRNLVIISGLGLIPRCVFEPLDLSTSKMSPNCSFKIQVVVELHINVHQMNGKTNNINISLNLL